MPKLTVKHPTRTTEDNDYNPIHILSRIQARLMTAKWFDTPEQLAKRGITPKKSKETDADIKNPQIGYKPDVIAKDEFAKGNYINRASEIFKGVDQAEKKKEVDSSKKADIAEVLDKSNFYRNESDKNGCKRACDQILKNAKIDPSLDPNRKDVSTLKEIEDSSVQITPDTKRGVEVIDEYLESGNPITVGVHYKFDDYNEDKTTDHFILIVGRGTDQEGRVYYRFWDVVQNNTATATSPLNRLYLDPETSQLIGRSVQWPSKTYTVSLVRPNIKK